MKFIPTLKEFLDYRANLFEKECKNLKELKNYHPADWLHFADFDVLKEEIWDGIKRDWSFYITLLNREERKKLKLGF